MRFPQIYQVGFLTILIWGSIELVRAKLGPSVLMTREAGKLSLWWLAPILASIRWSLGFPATCAHCSLKILKRLARFSNTILSCQLSSDEQHDATYQLKLFYKFCELWFILWYEELPYCISSHERNALSPLLVWGPCLRGQQGLLPGSGVRGGLGERESGNEQYCCFVVPGNVLRSVLHRLQMLHGSGAQLSTIRGPQRPVMITATCQVGETTGASHYLSSSAPAQFWQFVRIEPILLSFFSLPTSCLWASGVWFIGELIYRVLLMSGWWAVTRANGRNVGNFYPPQPPMYWAVADLQ